MLREHKKAKMEDEVLQEGQESADAVDEESAGALGPTSILTKRRRPDSNDSVCTTTTTHNDD